MGLLPYLVAVILLALNHRYWPKPNFFFVVLRHNMIYRNAIAHAPCRLRTRLFLMIRVEKGHPFLLLHRDLLCSHSLKSTSCAVGYLLHSSTCRSRMATCVTTTRLIA